MSLPRSGGGLGHLLTFREYVPGVNGLGAWQAGIFAWQALYVVILSSKSLAASRFELGFFLAEEGADTLGLLTYPWSYPPWGGGGSGINARLASAAVVTVITHQDEEE